MMDFDGFLDFFDRFSEFFNRFSKFFEAAGRLASTGAEPCFVWPGPHGLRCALCAHDSKINRKSFREAFPSEPCEVYLTLSLPEATRRRFRSSRGVSGRSRAPFSGPRGGLGEPSGAPGPPVGPPRGAPGMLQAALGYFPAAPGAPGGSPERFGIDFGCPGDPPRSDFGLFFYRTQVSLGSGLWVPVSEPPYRTL